MANLLYNKKNIIGRLFQYFQIYFSGLTVPTAENLFLLLLAVLALEALPSIRMLYRHFICRISTKSLNAFYHACSYAKLDASKFMNVTARLAVQIIPGQLRREPVFLCIDDTMAAKSGRQFEHVSKLFDHAAHNGSLYLNGHCFVSIMLCVPVLHKNSIVYQALPLGYRMWTKEVSKLALAASMIRLVMPELKEVPQAVLLFDSWYAKKELICLASEFENLSIICSARCDTAMFDLPPQHTGKRGRPAKRGKKLNLMEDFTLSSEKRNGYHAGFRKVLTNIFGDTAVYAYVTAADRTGTARRLFFSTAAPEDIRMSRERQEKNTPRQGGKERAQYLPLFCYSFRWNIEVSYYEQKTFWSLCAYRVRSRKGIENLLNLMNTAYCAMKLLPYQDESFAEYKQCSVQEFRMALSEQINQQIFFSVFVKNIENTINSNRLMKHLKTVFCSVGYYL